MTLIRTNGVRFNPWHDFDRLHRELERSLWQTQETPRTTERTQRWRPPVDILESDEAYGLRVDIPGVEPADVEVEVHEGTLTLRFERKAQEAEGVSWSLRERPTGVFTRQFRLPKDADVDGVQAKHHLGTLLVTVPKQPEVQPRRISVEA